MRTEHYQDRIERVKSLAEAMLNAMTDACTDDHTSGDVLSAVVSVLTGVVCSLQERGVDPVLLEQMVMHAMPVQTPGPSLTRPFDPKVN